MTKLALLIGISNYHSGLPPLPGTQKDIQAMQRVLEPPDMGGFDQVRTLANPDLVTMQLEVQKLLTEDRQPDDLILLYFSGHAITDDSGHLYFATPTTQPRNTASQIFTATAVPASFIQDCMRRSRSRRQVLLLDCCFSGAFAAGLTARSVGQTVNIEAQLGGEGRAVLTSSTATQLSFEEKEGAIYTRYIVEGIEKGAADTNSDGYISVDELHQYAKRKTQEAAPAMQPEIYAAREGYTIRLAKAPVGNPKLIYRKEVEELVQSSHGEISYLDRPILDALRFNLRLSLEETRAIEVEVLQPFEERKQKLQIYEQTWRTVIQRESEINEMTRTKLKRLQQTLKLRDEDTASIEAALPLPTPAPRPSPPPTPSPSPAPSPLPTPSRTLNPQPLPTPKPASTPIPRNPSSVTPREIDRDTTPRVTRQQFLKWASYGGGGLIVAVLGRAAFEGFASDPAPVASESSPVDPDPAPTLSSPEPVKATPISLSSFSFEVVTVNEKGQEISRKPVQANSFKENLGNGVELEMVSIPVGSFKMGSPDSEKDRELGESPQRTVNVPAFSIGKFPVTQAQYQAMMDTNPSSFTTDGANRPVENVSWDDAKRFCEKLSQKTGRTYRLPSEAEWEYACRAKTTTPFHFGETITTDLANYNGSNVYRSEAKGTNREQTTAVGSFPPNAFGLYDMHGNVWEWCEDVYHDSYQDAPTDGSAWVTGGDGDTDGSTWGTGGDNTIRLLRGGSWYNYPGLCRSACRLRDSRDVRSLYVGFRVVCLVSRTLS